MVAKAITEVRKPGAEGKVASVPYVFQLITQTVSLVWHSRPFSFLLRGALS